MRLQLGISQIEWALFIALLSLEDGCVRSLAVVVKQVLSGCKEGHIRVALALPHHLHSRRLEGSALFLFTTSFF